MADVRKVEVGFEGGQVVSARVSEEALGGLRKALESDKRWFDVDTDDGTLALDLDRVAFLRIPDVDHRVGF